MGNFLLDKDIPITFVIFITILQNQQTVSCFVTIDSLNSRRIDTTKIKSDKIHSGLGVM